MLDGPVESPLLAESANVHLVDDRRGQLEAGPSLSLQANAPWSTRADGPVDTFGLPRRPGVGAPWPSVERKEVTGTGLRLGYVEAPPAPMARLAPSAAGRKGKHQLDALGSQEPILRKLPL